MIERFTYNDKNESDNWTSEAACAGTDPELFFPERSQGRGVAARLMAAKAICAECPVTAACLESAISNNEQFGVWGGTSAEERAHLSRRSRRVRQTY